MLRNNSFALLKGHQSPRQARELFFVTGTTCVLLAHASQNLGDCAAAMAQVRTAWTCAEQADHDGLRAWSRGTAALIAEWSNQQRAALRYAEEGQCYAATPDSQVRLAAIAARAAAWTGDRARAMAALDIARRARDAAARSDELDQFGGLLTFPLAKQLYYAGTTYILLVDADHAQQHALDAIALYESGPGHCPFLRPRSTRTLGRRRRTHRTRRRTWAVKPVLALPTEQRIRQLDVSLSRVRSALTLPPFARAAVARSLANELDEFRAAESVRSLLSRQ